ncbi:N-acetyltransferase [Bacteroidia bacterium]|nr:N-acetyltransferase [Bacteroidia bacterium]
MDFLEDFCTVFSLSKVKLAQCQPFTCGDADLDDFFYNDVDNYSQQLLGKSYCYCLNENPSVIVCAFTLANASMDVRHLPGSRRKKVTTLIPHEKMLSSYPAFLVCRLGVNTAFHGKGIGKNLMECIKVWVTNSANIGGCRYIVVDAYNNEKTRRYYESNAFSDVFSTEQQEKEYLGMPPEKELKTRLMYFDLMLLSNKI